MKYTCEDSYLEKTLALAEKDGYETAYDFLCGAMQEQPQLVGPQSAYFAACLAAGTGREQEAIQYLADAVDGRGWWYRPEVLEDDDLASVAALPEFVRLCDVSSRRYANAAVHSHSVCSRTARSADNLLLVAHGNTQNAAMARAVWQPLAQRTQGWQLETVQSGTVDGFGTFRWEYDDQNYRQFAAAAQAAEADGYAHTVWGGFSAGCDMLLRTVLYTPLRCDTLLLQSPWLPLLDTEKAQLCAVLAKKQMSLQIFCGSEDEDCLPCTQALLAAAREAGVKAVLTVQPGLYHEFPPVLGQEYTLPY